MAKTIDACPPSGILGRQKAGALQLPLFYVPIDVYKRQAREFGNYCYVCDRDGRPTGDAPDRDNHHIDAARYALWSVWARS